MKVLAVDYDGVIVDSVMDSLFVSHNAYLRLLGSANRQKFGGQLFTFQNWPIIQQKYSKEIQYYRSLRPYIRGATDYGLIQKLMEEGKHIQSQREFDQHRETVQFDFKKFDDAFYQERKRLQQENFKGWLSLEPPYKEVIRCIHQFVQEGMKVMIATSNRREYIARAFQPLYHDVPIEPEDILDNRFGEDKSSQMHHICDKYGVDYQDIYFVDDQLAHLEQTRDLGIHVFLAGWSYATGKQKKDARAQGIPVMEREEEFYPKIKEYVIRK
jgi:phosphoglycolate phosphatase-like HAD superfamily hydrolase